VLRLLAALFDSAPGSPSWLGDIDNFNHVRLSIDLVLDALRPASVGDQTDLDTLMGKTNAAALAYDLAKADGSMPPRRKPNILDFVKADLGPAADRLRALEDLEDPGDDRRSTKRRAKR
jgi:hypothetical protein